MTSILDYGGLGLKLTFKVPVFDDADLAFAKMIQERYQPDVMFLSAGNPEPKAEGNIVQHQLDRLKELWETIAADIDASEIWLPSNRTK